MAQAGDTEENGAGGLRRRRRNDGVAMAMDGARRDRGAAIDAARRRLIVEQRRAPDSRYNINVTRSDLTSPDRDLPDTRPSVCLTANYTRTKHLPTASVIIPFYNEALSMILRAVHSVLNKSPDNLLDEVGLTVTRSVCSVSTSRSPDVGTTNVSSRSRLKRSRAHNFCTTLCLKKTSPTFLTVT